MSSLLGQASFTSFQAKSWQQNTCSCWASLSFRICSWRSIFFLQFSRSTLLGTPVANRKIRHVAETFLLYLFVCYVRALIKSYSQDTYCQIRHRFSLKSIYQPSVEIHAFTMALNYTHLLFDRFQTSNEVIFMFMLLNRHWNFHNQTAAITLQNENVWSC